MSDVLKALNLEFTEQGLDSKLGYSKSTGIPSSDFLVISSKCGYRTVSVNAYVDGELQAVEYTQRSTKRDVSRKKLGNVPLCDPVAFEDFVSMVVERIKDITIYS